MKEAAGGSDSSWDEDDAEEEARLEADLAALEAEEEAFAREEAEEAAAEAAARKGIVAAGDARRRRHLAWHRLRAGGGRKGRGACTAQRHALPTHQATGLVKVSVRVRARVRVRVRVG